MPSSVTNESFITMILVAAIVNIAFRLIASLFWKTGPESPAITDLNARISRVMSYEAERRTEIGKRIDHIDGMIVRFDGLFEEIKGNISNLGTAGYHQAKGCKLLATSVNDLATAVDLVNKYIADQPKADDRLRDHAVRLDTIDGQIQDLNRMAIKLGDRCNDLFGRAEKDEAEIATLQKIVTDHRVNLAAVDDSLTEIDNRIDGACKVASKADVRSGLYEGRILAQDDRIAMLADRVSTLESDNRSTVVWPDGNAMSDPGVYGQLLRILSEHVGVDVWGDSIDHGNGEGAVECLRRIVLEWKDSANVLKQMRHPLA